MVEVRPQLGGLVLVQDLRSTAGELTLDFPCDVRIGDGIQIPGRMSIEAGNDPTTYLFAPRSK